MAIGKPNNPQPVTVHRDSETGRFVTEEYTQRHPRTTETEHYNQPSKPKKPSK